VLCALVVVPASATFWHAVDLCDYTLTHDDLCRSIWRKIEFVDLRHKFVPESARESILGPQESLWGKRKEP